MTPPPETPCPFEDALLWKWWETATPPARTVAATARVRDAISVLLLLVNHAQRHAYLASDVNRLASLIREALERGARLEAKARKPKSKPAAECSYFGGKCNSSRCPVHGNPNGNYDPDFEPPDDAAIELSEAVLRAETLRAQRDELVEAATPLAADGNWTRARGERLLAAIQKATDR